MSTFLKRSARGLTLIELTVVLLILVALAGILVPQISGYLARSHASSSSTNIAEINKAVPLHEVKNIGQGVNDYDQVVVQASGAAPTVNGAGSSLAFSIAAVGTVPAALTATEVASLANAGMTSVTPADDDVVIADGESATFRDGGVPAAITTATRLLRLNAATVNEQLGTGLDTVNFNYYAFGLGARSSLIGKVMASAPVHFDEADPARVYSRFFVVYAVPSGTITPASNAPKAKFVGALGAEMNGLGEHVGEYYSPDAQ